MKLGITTDTDDITGKVCSRTGNIPDTERIVHALSVFQGEMEQIPPMYSAIKVNGKKLYELARQGVVVERKSRKIWIYKNKFLAFYPPDMVLFETVCSKGTYIRSLCRDIGNFLDCGAVMSYLIRTVSGNFSLPQSYTLDEIVNAHRQGECNTLIILMEKALESILPSIILNGSCKEKISNGNKIGTEYIDNSIGTIVPGKHCSIFCGNTFMGIGYLSDDGKRRVVKMKSVLI